MTHKILRQAKRIAKPFGYQYAGILGSGHIAFELGNDRVVLGFSPKNQGHALKNFRADLERRK